MKTKAIIAAAVVIATPLLTAIVFITYRPSPPAITVRHVKSVRSGDWVAATFEITNHTDLGYLVDPFYVVARNGLGWPITGN